MIVHCFLWWDIKLGFLRDFTLKVLQILGAFCIKLPQSSSSLLVNSQSVLQKVLCMYILFIEVNPEPSKGW